eukprot:scaffold5904_cov134-Isochrysis_galbana.AAC.5
MAHSNYDSIFYWTMGRVQPSKQPHNAKGFAVVNDGDAIGTIMVSLRVSWSPAGGGCSEPVLLSRG